MSYGSARQDPSLVVEIPICGSPDEFEVEAGADAIIGERFLPTVMSDPCNQASPQTPWRRTETRLACWAFLTGDIGGR